MLYICATPIGNLEDISLRVLRLLRESDIIAAEDTRHTRKLLTHFEISTPMTSYHEHSGEEKTAKLLDMLVRGRDVALVSDAGTPGISDPGERLVRACIEKDIPITSAPGPTAAITALVLSGLSSGRFVFEGFLPRGKKARAEILQAHVCEERTAIFYEAPHHLKKTLEDMQETLGERQIALARELTKKYEEVVRGSISSFIEYFNENEPKGEYVIIVCGAGDLKQKRAECWLEMSLQEHMDVYLKQDLDKKSAMKAVAKDRGLPKNEIYRQLIRSE